MNATPIAADAIVVGAGPAGSAAAIVLAKTGARVLLLERDIAARFKPGEIVEPTVRYPLTELGLLRGFETLTVMPVAGNLSVWGAREPVEADGILNPHGYGYYVERARMDAWLADQAALVGARLIRGTRKILVREGDRPVVGWEGNGRCHEASASIVVDASGRGPGIAGERTRKRHDALVALLAYVDDAPEGPRDLRLFIEAAEDGWWYSAPLPNRRTVLAFMTDADLVPATAERRRDLFRRRLAETLVTRCRLPDSLSVATVRVCPAMSTMRTTVSGAGWVAIGDAASTYDPLSGRGVVAALNKGAALARLILGGDVARAGREYAAAEAAAYDDYLAMSRRTYARERRWPRSVFWTRRQ